MHGNTEVNKDVNTAVMHGDKDNANAVSSPTLTLLFVNADADVFLQRRCCAGERGILQRSGREEFPATYVNDQYPATMPPLPLRYTALAASPLTTRRRIIPHTAENKSKHGCQSWV